jgi:hypothetical protein
MLAIWPAAKTKPLASTARASRAADGSASPDPMSRAADRLPDPPASFDSEHAAQLTAQTEAALERQRRELALSIDKAFEYIPRPLRGTIRLALER